MFAFACSDEIKPNAKLQNIQVYIEFEVNMFIATGIVVMCLLKSNKENRLYYNDGVPRKVYRIEGIED